MSIKCCRSGMVDVYTGNDTNLIIFLSFQLFGNCFIFLSKISAYIDTSAPGFITGSNRCSCRRGIRCKRSTVISLGRTSHREIHHSQIISTGKNCFLFSLHRNRLCRFFIFIGTEEIICQLNLWITHTITDK